MSGWRYLLLLVPFVWQLGLMPWANGVRADWLAIPFSMAWQMLGIVAASLSIGALYRIERRAAADGTGDEAP